MGGPVLGTPRQSGWDFGRPGQDFGRYAVGGTEVSFGDQEFSGIGRILPEIHSGFLQGRCTPHSSDEEGRGFPLGA